MYLVTTYVGTPGWQPDLDAVHRTLFASAAGSDGLEHAYLEARGDTVAISLYLLAGGSPDAVRRAVQLSRRAMAALPGGRRWSVRGTSAELR
ncbi:hypothetical protein B5D80_11395 [Micromonospora wenchangensis]|uniref:YCII-related domain-containing protein n=1 Tax=Micromonospora wenchangensis TaxID=1185415 RepID=A0A246RNQ8_9ACTN|nr:hypothetical protein B5D80_11395 [Micromonospora wenchangensis]